MKLRHLRVSRRPDQPDAEKASTKVSGSGVDALRSIREELETYRKAVRSQRYIIARYEAMLRRQRRLVSVSLAIAFALAAVIVLAVTAQWLGWQDSATFARWLERFGMSRPG